MSWVASEAFNPRLEPLLRQTYPVEDAVAGRTVFHTALIVQYCTVQTIFFSSMEAMYCFKKFLEGGFHKYMFK
jgi:hypothetical protein